MNLLIDPNISYLLLVGGLVLAVLALFAPGTGIIELGALFALVVAGYGIYNLPSNLWALGVLLIGMVAFVFSIRRARQWVFLIISAVAVVVGAVFIFRGEGGKPGVNPILALVVSPSALLFLWMVGRKSIEASARRPVHNLERLVGMIGQAHTAVYQEGSVYVGSEEWSARSEIPILEGSKVRVVARDGLILLVEPVQEKTDVRSG